MRIRQQKRVRNRPRYAAFRERFFKGGLPPDALDDDFLDFSFRLVGEGLFFVDLAVFLQKISNNEHASTDLRTHAPASLGVHVYTHARTHMHMHVYIYTHVIRPCAAYICIYAHTSTRA